MADISNKTLSIIIGIALIVSAISILSLPNGLYSIAGYVTYITSGQARINITELAQINLTHSLIDFGNGTVEPGQVNCTLTSETPGPVTADPLNCWTGSGAQSGGFDAANVGNVRLNVTFTATKNGSLTEGLTSFWGAEGTRYMYRCAVGIANATNLQPTYITIENRTASNRQLCVSNLSATSGNEGFSLHINITFPETILGVKNDTLTFTAIKTLTP